MESRNGSQSSRTHAQPSRDAVVSVIGAAAARTRQQAFAGVTEATRLKDELGLDSATILELLMEIERDLDVEFEPETLEQRHFETVGSLTDYVLREMA
jgi:acyl carrier protein